MKEQEGYGELEAGLPVEHGLKKGCFPGPLSLEISSNIIEKYVPRAFLIAA